jgi:hypothetical protein
MSLGEEAVDVNDKEIPLDQTAGSPS